MASNPSIPGRKHHFSYIPVVVCVLADLVIPFGIPIQEFTTVLILQGLSLDFIGAAMLATTDTSRLYGRLSSQDIAREVERRERGMINLERSLSLTEGDDGFGALARGFEQKHERDISVDRFEIEIPDTKDWKQFENEPNKIQAHRDFHIITKDPPWVTAVTEDGTEISVGAPRVLKEKVSNAIIQLGRKRQNSYLFSAMAVFAIGFLFQILAYLLKITL